MADQDLVARVASFVEFHSLDELSFSQSASDPEIFASIAAGPKIPSTFVLCASSCSVKRSIDICLTETLDGVGRLLLVLINSSLITFSVSSLLTLDGSSWIIFPSSLVECLLKSSTWYDMVVGSFPWILSRGLSDFMLDVVVECTQT